MKKSLFSLLGMTLLIGSVWAANGDLDISELFDGETPRVSDAYQRLLNDYDNARGYSESPRVGCQDVNKIRVSSEPVEDLFLDDASQYILFISPYSMDRIKRGDSSIDYSKIIMKRKIIGNIPEGAVLDSFFFDIFSDEIDSKQKYYGFIVPVDSYDGVGRPSSEFELNMSECFGTISIANPDNPSEGITILDRNLGATTNDITSPDSYGYHYQWGNNYGFSQKSEPEVSTTRVKWDEKYNNSGYYGETFIRITSSPWDYWEDGNHYGLRGGANDSVSNNRGVNQTNPTDRQGPCPTGYHVPSAGEWGLLVKYRGDSNNVNLSVSHGLYYFSSEINNIKFKNYFKLPNAGSRDANMEDTPLLNQDGLGEYRSSSPNGLYLYMDSSLIRVDDEYSYDLSRGISVRCFKNTYEPEEVTTVTTLKPGLNSFSTPAVVDSISFSNGGDNISFAKMVNGKWTPVTFTDSNVKSVIRPLDGFIVRNSNSEDVTMTIVYDNDIDINDALPQKQLDAGWNFLGITKTVSPFETVANAVVKDVIDFTFGNTNKIDLSKLRDATSFMLGKAYGVFVNNSNGIYGGRNNPNGNGSGNGGGTTYPPELQEAYEWAYENGITLPFESSIDDADLYENITRAELAYILSKWGYNKLLVADVSMDCDFDDIYSLGDYLKNGIIEACELNLMGQGITSFRPNDTLSRAEYFVLLSRALRGDKYGGGTPYYSNHMKALKTAGIIKQTETDAPENTKMTEGFVLLTLMRAETNSSDVDCDDEMVALACQLGTDACPEVCRPVGILTNNITKAVVFPADGVYRKSVFAGTYTASKPQYITSFYLSGENNLIGAEVTFYISLDGEEIGETNLESSRYNDTIIELNAGETINIMVEAEVEANGFTGVIEDIQLYLGRKDENRSYIQEVGSNLAPVKIVDSSNELSVQAMSGKNTVLLNEHNAVLGRFMVMPTNSTQGYFDNLVLKVTNPEGSTLDYDDIELRIDGTEIDEGDWQSSDGRLGYEDLDKLVDSLGSEVEVSIKNPDDGEYVLDIIDINTVGTSHFGKDPIITFNKRFESALVYIESQRNEDDQTHYILGVDKYDDSDVIPNLRLFTGYDVEQNECVGSLSFDKLSGESFYFEDGDEIVINNGNDAQLIKCIEYIVAYDGQECVDLDENNNCNEYMPVMQIRSRVSINKNDYLDYFKTRTGGFRKVFGRDSVGNGVCGDGVIDAGENCSNCPVDLGDICNTNCNSVDDLQFSHSIDKNGLITLNWTPNRQVYIEVKDSSEADGDYGSDHGISEDKVNSPFVFDAGGHPNYYKFFAYDNYQQCDHYKRYVVDATNVCSGVDNLDIQHQIQNGKIILSWDSDVNLSIATVAPPLTLEMLESGQVTLTSETVENGTFSYDIHGSGDYIFILENNFWCDNERYYTVHVD